MKTIEVKKKKITVELNAKKIFPPLEDLEVTPIGIEQNFKSSMYGYDNVKVKAVESSTLNIIPAVEEQQYIGLYGIVNVEKIPDEYIIPRGTLNITTSGEYDVTEYKKANVEVEGWKEELINLLDNNGKGANVKRLPSELTSIGYYALAYREDMKLEELPSGLKTIAGYGLRSCTSLDLTKFPDTIETIGTNACRGCTKLALTELPKNLKVMGTYAFAECDSLAITEIPPGVTLLDQYLFYESGGFTKMTLHENIETINQRVFYGCVDLIEVDVRTSKISTLAGYTFYNCTNLSKVIMRSITPPSITTTTFAGTAIANGNGYIYVPDESLAKYQNGTNWARYAPQIKRLSELEE